MVSVLVDFDRLEALIAEKGKKKSYLCELAGHTRSYISTAKAGYGTISEEALKIFARELGTTVEYLKGETDEQKEKPGQIPLAELSEEKQQLIKVVLEMTDERAAALLRALNE